VIPPLAFKATGDASEHLVIVTGVETTLDGAETTVMIVESFPVQLPSVAVTTYCVLLVGLTVMDDPEILPGIQL
jgi:hypothetical protein